MQTRHNLFPSDHPAGEDRLSVSLCVSVYEHIVSYLLLWIEYCLEYRVFAGILTLSQSQTRIGYFLCLGQIVGGVAVGLQDHPAVYGGAEKL